MVARDAEEADIAREAHELEHDPEGELEELAGIYRKRGLDPELAKQVAVQLSKGGGTLGAHLRDELGIEDARMARPFQAAVVSAASFASMGLLPVLALLVAPASMRVAFIAVVSLASLAMLGALGGRLGGAPMMRAALRVILGGGAAMVITAIIGHLLGLAGVG
ncbi:MAG: VIT1/CCC1 transporter family protein [Polyangiaceae bacterium]